MGGNSGDNSGGNSGGNSGSNSGSNGLHAGGPPLNPAALQRHLRFTLLTHVIQRTDGIARTSGPDVPTWAHCNAAWDILKELDAAALDRMQDNWNQPGQQSQQSWNPFADVGSTEATNPALNVEGHCESDSPSCQQTANVCCM